MTLDREERIAFARIISDLIEADFIVEKGEMASFESIISKEQFAISRNMLIKAKHETLEHSIARLRLLNTNQKVELIQTLESMSLSDGTCVPSEATLILAIRQALIHNARIFSVPSSNAPIERMSVIYIENTEGTDCDRYICQNYRSICNEFTLSGFEFVHIPHVVADFAQMDSEYLRKVVRYIIPSVSDERIEEICNRLCTMTTAQFCRDMLYKRIGINLMDAKPAMLIKISESDVVASDSADDALRTRYSNFLLLELGDDILRSIREMIDSYRAIINCPVTVESRPKTEKFIYYGFHRSLFDLIAYGKELSEYKLMFDFRKNREHTVYMQDKHSDKIIDLYLNPQQIALYALMVKESLNGDGLDWREEPENKKSLLEEYNKYYWIVGQGRSVREYKDRVHAHLIRKELQKYMDEVANLDSFIPVLDKTKDLKALYKIPILAENVEFMM